MGPPADRSVGFQVRGLARREWDRVLRDRGLVPCAWLQGKEGEGRGPDENLFTIS